MAQNRSAYAEGSALAPFAIPRGLIGLAGIALAICAVIAAAGGGDRNTIAAALLGTLALRFCLLSVTHARMPWFPSVFVDAAVIAGYVFLCDPNVTLWKAAEGWGGLFRMSSVGAAVSVAQYICVMAFIGLSWTRRASAAATAATVAIPFVFCIFMALGSELPAALGRALTLGAPLPAPVHHWIGAAIDLFVVNEAVIAGAAIALGRRRPLDWRLHGTLALAAIFAAATPIFAELGSSAALARLPPVVAVLATALAAAAAQAGLWGETYLATQAIADILSGRPPIAPGIRGPWITGMRKGAVYGFVFILLVGGAGALVASAPFLQFLATTGVVGACLLGAAAFPLARTVMESTDSTAPFARRLRIEFLRPSNFLRGLVVGAAVAVALLLDLPARNGLDRFLFGLAWGAGTSAGVELAIGIVPVLTRSRRQLANPRLYLLLAGIGAVIGGAVSWYLDAGQLEVVRAKFFAYNAIDYSAVGRAVQPMVIYPLFSKWGATNLGLVDGGVRLFYLESVSGVIQWVFAAPLFSINLFFLTAIVKRDLTPLRTLVSGEGIRLLVDNAVMVLRWGLWMAPVIYTFLKVAPTPDWYNQDGMVRTGVASVMALTLPPATFAQWSLDVFTALLAYDWLRVLIWFDHMGLRVATLVNLSFVGGDILDEKAARFLGKAQKSRVIPDGVRRFGTWAPLLLPFYIPRGAQWDQAWGTAERMRATPSPAGQRPARLPRSRRRRRARARRFHAARADRQSQTRGRHGRARPTRRQALRLDQRPAHDGVV